ncbi:MAG: DUF6159 family protein [Candidatus Micrarchaeia archaeon]
MFGAISNGFLLMKQSFSVLMKDKEILLFPIIASVFTGLAFISLFVPYALLLGVLGDYAEPVAFLLLFLFYFVSSLITIFFNAALVSCVNIRFSGGDPTFMDGIRSALRHLPKIIVWALFVATVGLALRMLASLAERSKSEAMRLIGRIVVSALGAAWSVATFFVVPIIVLENESNPLAAIKKSVNLVFRTWGENAVGQVSMAIFFFIAGILGAIPIVIGLSVGSLLFLILGIGFALIYWFLLAILNSALSSIFTVALYRYATTGKVVEDFSPELVRGAFAPHQ